MRRRNFCRAALTGAALAPTFGSQALASVYAGLLKVDRDLEAITRSGGEQILAQTQVQSLADSLRVHRQTPCAHRATYRAGRYRICHQFRP